MANFEWLNTDSRVFLERGYLSEGETPEQRIKDIADKAEDILGIEGFSDKFYDYMGRGFYSLSSPVWANFGKGKGLSISCFGSYVEDNIPSILNSASEVGIMSKYGGGTSGYFGEIRPRGSKITDNGETSGSVHFMKLFETETDVVSQGNTRRGRFSPYLPIDHPDIDEFLEIGTEGNPIQNMTHAVSITDDWMLEMINGDKEKRRIWSKVLTRRTQLGFPYIFFHTNANKNTVDVYKDKGLVINNSNLCVAPYTKILTDEGYKEIGKLKDQKVSVWNGEEWSEVTVKQTGENQEMLKVKTNSGFELDSTPYHKYYVLEETKAGKRTKPSRYKEVRAKDLKVGDKLIKFDLPVIEGQKELDFAYDNGFFTGDGTLNGKNQVIYLYGEKQKLANHFKSIDKWSESKEQDRHVGLTKKLEDKYFVPMNEYTIDSRLKWLAGFLDADGTVTNNNGYQSIQAGSINKEFLKDVQLMLQTLGVDSKVILSKKEGTTMMPANDGTGEYKEFKTKEIYRILINGNSLYKLDQLGFKCNRLAWETKEPNRECSQFIKVTGIEEIEETMDTFCFTEPKRHMGMFNGILTGQCSEIMLPNKEDWSFVCDLSSMNLVKYEEWKDTDAVETMIYFLDAVMSEFISDLELMRDSQDREEVEAFKLMERAYNFAKENRALGLGVLGWHSYLQSKLIPFESVEASRLNSQIFALIRKRAYKASEELANLLGEPEILKGYGRRNTTLLAVAPTTSSSFILGQVSKSIEPFMSNYYVVDTAKVKKTMINPYLKELLQEKGKDTKEVMESIRDNDGSVQHLDFLNQTEKEVFKTYGEINQYNILDQAATRQYYIDQGQSLNIMVNPINVTSEELNELYLFAWANGIKSLYYQHGTNAAQQFNLSKLCINCEA